MKHRKNVPHDATGTIARYNTGMSASTRRARARHFRRGAETNWKDSRAYRPAPGDATAKTRTSRHTLRFRKMYGESTIARMLQIVESAIKSLREKSSKTGVPTSILRQVYNRGVAAWRTGHRPGTTPEQWGHARVNSFLTGGKTRRTADADLWRRARSHRK
jgi:hypothetical protein